MAISGSTARGSGTYGNNGGSTTVTQTPGATVTVGKVLVTLVATRQNESVVSIADAVGNVWKYRGRYSNSTNGDAHVEVWTCVVKNQLSNTTTITCTFSGTINDACIATREYTVGSGQDLVNGPTPVGNEVNGANGFGSVSFASLASAERLYVRAGAKRANSTGTISNSANFTSWALNNRSRNSSTLAITLRGEERINTSTGETSNPTWAVSGNTAGLFHALVEAAEAIDLAADDTESGAPVFGTPTLEIAGASDDLEADGIAAGAPVLHEPEIGQAHALTATGVVAVAPVFGTPTITQSHALAATGVTAGAAALGAPTLAEAGTVDDLEADGITAGAPALGAPSIAQVHALTELSITAGAPVLGTPITGQSHVLAANGLAAGASVLGEPVIAQAHGLIAAGIAAGVPWLATPGLGGPGVDALSAAELIAGTPQYGAPSIGGPAAPDDEVEFHQRRPMSVHYVDSALSVRRTYRLAARGIDCAVPALGRPFLEVRPGPVQVRSLRAAAALVL